MPQLTAEALSPGGSRRVQWARRLLRAAPRRRSLGRLADSIPVAAQAGPAGSVGT